MQLRARIKTGSEIHTRWCGNPFLMAHDLDGVWFVRAGQDFVANGPFSPRELEKMQVHHMVELEMVTEAVGVAEIVPDAAEIVPDRPELTLEPKAERPILDWPTRRIESPRSQPQQYQRYDNKGRRR